MNIQYRPISPKGIYRSFHEQSAVSGRRPRGHNGAKYDLAFDLTLTLRNHGLAAEVVEVKENVARLRCGDLADYYCARNVLKKRGLSSQLHGVALVNGSNGASRIEALPTTNVRVPRIRPKCLVCGKKISSRNCRPIKIYDKHSR